jgi:hypothetical protein
LPERLALAETTRDAFRKEFGDQGPGAVWMGDRFRPCASTWSPSCRIPASPS